MSERAHSVMLMSACLEKHGSREFCRCRKIQAITGGGKEMDQNVNRSYLREGVLGIIYIYIFFFSFIRIF